MPENNQSSTIKSKSRSYWNSYYTKNSAPNEPSSYCKLVQKKIKKGAKLLEIGCGNGRDSAYFHLNQINVSAIDRCSNAISQCKKTFSDMSIQFFHGTLGEISEIKVNKFNVIYTRFVIHAMPEKDEVLLIKECFSMLEDNGRLYIECRSINDPLSKKGEKISQTERVYGHGHYRRFIIKDHLIENLKLSGLKIIDEIELDNVAIYGDDNPVVIRITAAKISN